MPQEILSSEKKHVITKNGMNLGEMTGCNIDTSKWVVTSIIVELHNDMTTQLNVKKPFMKRAMIKIRPDQIGVVGDVIHLSVDLEALKTNL